VPRFDLCASRTESSLLEGKSPVTLKAGDVLFIPAGAVHSARNVGREKGSELATYIVEKGKPLVEVVN
jgi:quercetin dioxygenase-like cupin family protein